MKKDDIKYVFAQSPELAKIGTKTQYYKYLKTIFPESKVQEILWHGSRSGEKIEEFDTEKKSIGKNFGKGVYATPDFSFAARYARGDQKGRPSALLGDVKNPLLTNKRYNEWHKVFSYIPDNESVSDYVDRDSVIDYESLDRDKLKKINEYLTEYIGEKDDNGLPIYQNDIYAMPSIKEVVLPSANQTHILGSKKDIQGFKKFVRNKTSTKSLEKIVSGIFIFSFLAGLFFSSGNLTGNVVRFSFSDAHKLLGIILVLVGISGFFVYRKLK